MNEIVLSMFQPINCKLHLRYCWLFSKAHNLLLTTVNLDSFEVQDELNFFDLMVLNGCQDISL